jgi:hypothetical protein
LEDQGVDGRMGSESVLGRLAGGVDGIQLAQDRDQWMAVVNTVMNLRVLAPRSFCNLTLGLCHYVGGGHVFRFQN